MPRTGRIVPPGYPHHIVQRGQLTGNQRFVDEVARIAGRRVEFRRPGRPPLSRDGGCSSSGVVQGRGSLVRLPGAPGPHL